MDNNVMTPKAFFEGLKQLNCSNGIRPCLILGNGFNQQFYSREEAKIHGWNNLLLDIAQKATNAKNVGYDIRHLIKNHDVANTEIADFIEAYRDASRDEGFEKSIVDGVTKHYKFDFHDKKCALLDYAWNNNFHIMTTNFDENIELYLKDKYSDVKINKYSIPGEPHQSQSKMEKRPPSVSRKPDSSKKFPRTQYQWNCFYGPQQKIALDLDTDVHELEHDIWHIHGCIKKSSGILFTSTKYAGAINRYRKLKYYPGDNSQIRNTWLKLFFECPLIIAGLGLTSQETFLRYLILQRFFERKDNDQIRSFYLCSGKSGAKDGRVFLAESGVTTVVFPSRKSIYNSRNYSIITK